MKCEICGKEILRDSQCINYKYYHNDCIEKLKQGIKHLDEVNCKLRRKIGQLEDNWNEVKKGLRKIRQLTFTKYNKNEWENCLSFNDDIEPLIEKMKELERGSDSNE